MNEKGIIEQCTDALLEAHRAGGRTEVRNGKLAIHNWPVQFKALVDNHHDVFVDIIQAYVELLKHAPITVAIHEDGVMFIRRSVRPWENSN